MVTYKEGSLESVVFTADIPEGLDLEGESESPIMEVVLLYSRFEDVGEDAEEALIDEDDWEIEDGEFTVSWLPEELEVGRYAVEIWIYTDEEEPLKLPKDSCFGLKVIRSLVRGES
jgi:hypothetical protein